MFERKKTYSNMEEVFMECCEMVKSKAIEKEISPETYEEALGRLIDKLMEPKTNKWFFRTNYEMQQAFLERQFKAIFENLENECNEYLCFNETIHGEKIHTYDNLKFMEEDSVRRTFNHVKLSPEEHRVIEARYIDMKDIKDIAESEKITANAVSRCINRAIKKIKNITPEEPK